MLNHTPRLRAGELAAMTPEARDAHLKAQAARYYEKQYKKRFPDRADGKQVCRRCRWEKPQTEEFFGRLKNVKSGFHSWCRECVSAKSKEHRVRKAYGITRAEYDAMFENASCAICGVDQRLVLDHCHNMGTPRGVLCNECNTGLGMFKDDPHRMDMAAAYIRQSLK